MTLRKGRNESINLQASERAILKPPGGRISNLARVPCNTDLRCSGFPLCFAGSSVFHLSGPETWKIWVFCFVALLLSPVRYERFCCPHLCFKGSSIFKGQRLMPMHGSWGKVSVFLRDYFPVFHPGFIQFGKRLKADSSTQTVELLAARCCGRLKLMGDQIIL